MGWASAYIEKLNRGEAVSFRPRGNSMAGKIESGQLCTVEGVDSATLRVGDIVLCKVKGREYLHLVKAIDGQRFQIGNNRGRINGWVSAGAIFGRCVRVETTAVRCASGFGGIAAEAWASPGTPIGSEFLQSGPGNLSVCRGRAKSSILTPGPKCRREQRLAWRALAS